MTQAEVIAAVKVRMADIMPDNQSEVTAQPFIELLINGCVDNFYMMLPLYLLPVTSFSSQPNTRVGEDSVYIDRIKLPDDFKRFIEMQCSTWTRPATTVLQQGSAQHYAQFNKYSFGGDNRPKVTLVNDETNGKCIEYYNYKLGFTTITKATCAVCATVADIPDELIDPYAWYVASVVFQSMEEIEASKAAFIKVTEFLQLHK